MLVLVQLGTHKQLDQSIVGACRDETLRARPIDTVNATHVMILLFKHNLYLLLAIAVGCSSTMWSRVAST